MIKSAKYVNPQSTRISVVLAEPDSLLEFSQKENPELWAEAQNWAREDGEIAPYVFVRTPYTIISANYANEDHSAATILTKENGAVAISETDTPEDWADLQKWAGKISPYVAPPEIIILPEEKLQDFIKNNPDVGAFLKSLVG